MLTYKYKYSNIITLAYCNIISLAQWDYVSLHINTSQCDILTFA